MPACLFANEKESIPVGCIVSTFQHASVATRWQDQWGGFWCKQVWTGLQWWSPEVTSRNEQDQGDVGGGEGLSLGVLNSLVQCIMGNGHIGTPKDRQTLLKILPFIPTTSLAGIGELYIVQSHSQESTISQGETLIDPKPEFLTHVLGLFRAWTN